MESYRQQKIQKLEEFVDGRLKPDLVQTIAQRDKVFEKQKVFSDLRKNIENLEKNSVTSLRTMVNLGSEVYMQAEVPDARRIFVDVGLGFHVEFTWSEALNYISQREEKLERYKLLFSSVQSCFHFLEEFVVVGYLLSNLSELVEIKATKTNHSSENQRVDNCEIEDYTNRIASIKSHIKMVCEGIRELLQLPAEKPVPELNF